MGYDPTAYRFMERVFLASVVAAAIIEYILLNVLFYGVGEAFSPPTVYSFPVLIAIAVFVYFSLLGFVRRARPYVSRLLPLGILGASLAFILALTDSTRIYAAVLIAATYYVELVVGYYIWLDVRRVSQASSDIFISGMAVFILSLPLAIADNRLALILVIANAVKAAGLSGLYFNARWHRINYRPASGDRNIY